MKSRICSVAIALQLVAVAIGQEQTVVDVLPLVDIDAHVRAGTWSKTDDGLTANVTEEKAICVLPYELKNDYEFNCEFTRESGTDVVGVVLPLAKKQVFLELSGWSGQTHGLSRINNVGTLAESNPTAVRPGELNNGKRYEVTANVQLKGDQVAVKVRLDGEALIDWSGTLDEIEANIAYNIQSNSRIAIAASKSVTTFHSITLRHGVGQGKPVPAAKAMAAKDGGKVDLTVVALQKASGNIGTVAFQGEQVLQLDGGGEDSVALLLGIELADGTIEVDIASDIFSGIAFRAADLKNYELVYFRPQNSGTAKHDYTVQYVSKGMPGKEWRTLREESPGKYEAGADMKVNEWFRAKIVVKGDSLSVYVDDSPEPVLVVDEMFGGRTKGKIGIWGWNTRFRNFSFEPAD